MNNNFVNRSKTCQIIDPLTYSIDLCETLVSVSHTVRLAATSPTQIQNHNQKKLLLTLQLFHNSSPPFSQYSIPAIYLTVNSRQWMYLRCLDRRRFVRLPDVAETGKLYHLEFNYRTHMGTARMCVCDGLPVCLPERMQRTHPWRCGGPAAQYINITHTYAVRYERRSRFGHTTAGIRNKYAKNMICIPQFMGLGWSVQRARVHHMPGNSWLCAFLCTKYREIYYRHNTDRHRCRWHRTPADGPTDANANGTAPKCDTLYHDRLDATYFTRTNV